MRHTNNFALSTNLEQLNTNAVATAALFGISHVEVHQDGKWYHVRYVNGEGVKIALQETRSPRAALLAFEKAIIQHLTR